MKYQVTQSLNLFKRLSVTLMLQVTAYNNTILLRQSTYAIGEMYKFYA